MAGQAGRVYYRIVKSDPPTMRDFQSNREKGLPRRPVEAPDLWAGLSMYEDINHARGGAQRFPAIGSHIAAVLVPDDGRFRVYKTLGPGHFTVWGEASALLGAVVAVSPVAGPAGRRGV